MGLGLLAVGCATHSQDLERARRHYQDLQFEKALALLRVLGDEPDLLSPAERVQYAYLRGMTDVRLADTQTDDALRQALRACARDWLDDSLRRDQAGALSPDQNARARSALAQLIDVESDRGACLR